MRWLNNTRLSTGICWSPARCCTTWARSIHTSSAASFPLTDDGRLVGHITNGALMVDRAAAGISDFPADLRRDLLHLIVSHHGTLEWGSPVPPRTLEAVLLHQVDLLDSRLQGFMDHVDGEPGDVEWTSPSPMFGYELKRKV